MPDRTVRIDAGFSWEIRILIPAGTRQRTCHARAMPAMASSEAFKTGGRVHSYHRMVRPYHRQVAHDPGASVKCKLCVGGDKALMTASSSWRPALPCINPRGLISLQGEDGEDLI